MVFYKHFRSLLKFIYPAECLHCEDEVEGSHQPLCRECLSQVEWAERGCLHCGVSLDDGRMCERCSKRPLYLQPHASLFTSLGPLSCLHSAFLQTKRPETLAAFAMMGLSRHSFPLPDCVVPLLRPRYEGFALKKQSSALLAKGVAKLLGCPTYLPCNKVEGKTVLLLSDWLSDGEWLRLKKQELKQFFPKKIYSIALIDAR